MEKENQIKINFYHKNLLGIDRIEGFSNQFFTSVSGTIKFSKNCEKGGSLNNTKVKINKVEKFNTFCYPQLIFSNHD